MTLERLINIIDSKINSDIRAKNRKRHNVYAKKMYCKLAYDMDLRNTQQEIANTLGCNHDLVLYHKDSFESVNDKYKIAFNEIIEDYDLDVEKSFIKEKKEDVNTDEVPVLTEYQLELLRDLNEMSDSDAREIRETRLKPYVSMLKTRKKPRKINVVPGSRIDR